MSGEIQMLCPNCGKKMVLRTGRRGQFWGCTGFPVCRFTKDYVEQVKTTKKFEPSKYQQAVFEFIKEGTGNAVVEAVAGSGKTTTIVQALQFTKGKVVFLAFNKKIAQELSRRAPIWVNCSTLHSLGFKCLNANLPAKPIVSDDKKMGIAKELFPNDADRPMRTLLCRLASLAQNTLTDPTDREAVVALIDRYSIETSGNGDEERLIQALPAMIRECQSRTGVIDYDDMIWLPVVLNLPMEKYDWVFTDESQDLCTAQVELVLRSIRPVTGRFVGVGDTFQSIYGFRGADTNAIPRLIEATHSITLPLSITYRCPISHVKLARALVPHLEPAEWAQEGEVVENYPTHKMVADAKSGDLVMCRINAPLVGVCYDFIRAGKKATIAGRDIGKGLLEMIDKMAPTSVPELLQKVAAYRDKEIEKLTKAGKENRIAALEDKCETLIALCSGMDNLSDLRANIERIFTDDVEGIVCSSIHRAKGLEADTTYILLPEMLGVDRRDKTPEAQQQSLNVEYVACTRAKKRMVFVEGFIPANCRPATTTMD